MTWTEALEIVVARTKHERYRVLCSDDHRDREIWRARLISHATGEPIQRPVESPDQTIARVESMAARANAGERGGGCGPCP